jgi:Fe-S cluster assembly iron-binding protein IscA
MKVEVTPEAADVIRRSLVLGGVDPATGGVRLRLARGLAGGSSVQVELASAALEGEVVIESDGLRLFVEPTALAGLTDPVVALEEPHDKIVLRSK